MFLEGLRAPVALPPRLARDTLRRRYRRAGEGRHTGNGPHWSRTEPTNRQSSPSMNEMNKLRNLRFTLLLFMFCISDFLVLGENHDQFEPNRRIGSPVHRSLPV